MFKFQIARLNEFIDTFPEKFKVIEIDVNEYHGHFCNRDMNPDYINFDDIKRPVLLAEVAPDRLHHGYPSITKDYYSRAYIIDGHHRLAKAKEQGNERRKNMNYPLYIVNVESTIYENDKWLIIKRSEKEEHAPGLLSLVGGKVESKLAENNILEETVKREIMEEVGIEVFDVIHYVESKSFMTDNGENVIDIVFLCKYKSGEARCM